MYTYRNPISRSLPPTNRTLAHQSCRAYGHDSRRKESTATSSEDRRAAASLDFDVPLAGKTRVKPKKRYSSDGSSASRCRLHPLQASRRMSNSPPVEKKKTKRRHVRQPRPRAPNPRDIRPVMASASKRKHPSSGGPSVTSSRRFQKRCPRRVSLSPVRKMEPLPLGEDANTTRNSRIDFGPKTTCTEQRRTTPKYLGHPLAKSTPILKRKYPSDDTECRRLQDKDTGQISPIPIMEQLPQIESSSRKPDSRIGKCGDPEHPPPTIVTILGPPVGTRTPILPRKQLSSVEAYSCYRRISPISHMDPLSHAKVVKHEKGQSGKCEGGSHQHSILTTNIGPPLETSTPIFPRKRPSSVDVHSNYRRISPIPKMDPVPQTEVVKQGKSEIDSTKDSKETKVNIDIQIPKEMTAAKNQLISPKRSKGFPQERNNPVKRAPMATTNQRISPKPSDENHADAVGHSLHINVKETKITQESASEVVAVNDGRKTKASPFKWFTSLKKRVSKSAIFSALHRGCSSVCCLRSKTLS